MNRFYTLLLIFSFIGLSTVSYGQDTLPKFSVTNVGKNHIIIGWVNNYDLVKQISIQSSHDSLKNYKTILSVVDPMAKENGFVDTKAINDHMYYRLFVVLDKGQFFFTTAKQPVLDTLKMVRNTRIDNKRDSFTTDIKPITAKKPDFIPSFFVYTNRDGYVHIHLPDADRMKYHLKFYGENDEFLFEIKNIKDTSLTLDKTNFLHSGWFRFELYNDDKLVEKNKFYLAKDF